MQAELGGGEFDFYPGVSYRHLMVWHGGKDQLKFTPPHDLTMQSVEEHMPQGEGAAELISLMTSAQILLHHHPVNDRRKKQWAEPPANSIWLWGHGRAPKMATYSEMFGLSGAVISAVDLIRGIGVYAGLESIQCSRRHRLYRHQLPRQGRVRPGSAENAAISSTSTSRRPDEAAHSGNLEDKLRRSRVSTNSSSAPSSTDCPPSATTASSSSPTTRRRSAA